MSSPAILLIDPDPASAEALHAALGRSARVDAVRSLSEGLERLRDGGWAAVVLSLDLPAVDLAVAERVLQSAPGLAALALLTRRPTVRLAVQAARLGVVGVLGIPVDPGQVREVLWEVLAPSDETVPLDPGEEEGEDGEAAVGQSPVILEVFRVVGRVAPSAATVLITGESGTGKELVARAIHRNSDRSGGPFVAVNCAAIPENLLESELFGHEKGAFTGAIARKIGRFERASGGTLFLDEIGDMSLALQAKILRALQEREIERVGGEGRIPVDVRVVAATNQELRAATAEGSFREDLYFRLAVVTLHLPRLVERGTDLELLIQHFAARYSARYERGITGIARSVFDLLRRHEWPGNVRELQNVIERAVLMSHGPVLRPEHLPHEQLRSATPAEDGAVLPGYSPSLSAAEVERLHIREVLQRVDGHMGRASEVLGLHRNTLTRKVREYGLTA